MKKFVDTLPGLGEAGVNNLGQYIPVAVPDTTTFPGADYYVIAVVQHREQMSSSLPASGTLLREYVQLSTTNVPGKQVPLTTALLDGSEVPTMMPDGVTQALGVDDPHYLGPTIVAQRDRAVNITFYNLLPTGSDGDLFLPTDSTLMGSGDGPMAMPAVQDLGTVTDEVRNPACTEYPKSSTECFKDNRATLHLHGGVTPWISDGTPHQWITPANETTPWPQGVSVGNVPDMIGGAQPAGVPDCSADNDGCQTFYYTNQQSARLKFYHDHAWGITRLNVYAGEAAGYLITDPTEQKLFGPSGTYADMGEGIPLVIQDCTFVPSAAQLAGRIPRGTPPAGAAWATSGTTTLHAAQNPGDPSGMSAYGRWMYGPWFWPPATPVHGPIDNPYYGKDPATNFTTDLAVPCSLDDPSTWQYQVQLFCEPAQIPGTPNISVGMEQFNDADRQRHGLPDHHPAPEGVSLPDPERGQRPLLEPVLVRRRQHRHRGRPQGVRGRGRADRHQHRPDAGRVPQPQGSRLDPDRLRGRLPAGSSGRAGPANDVDHRSDPFRRWQRGQAFDAVGTRRAVRRDRRLQQVRGPDTHPVQRCARRLPGPRRQLRLLHRRPGHGRRRGPARLRPEHSDRHAGQDRGQPAGCRVQPDEPQQRLQAPCRRLWCL